MHSQYPIPATVGILTYNNEDTLARCLDSLVDFEEVLVADGGSTDKTVEIAKSYGCKVIPQLRKGTIESFAKERNNLLSKATFDWFCFFDSDESASAGLIEEIRLKVATNIPGVFRSQFKVKFGQQVVHWYTSYPGWRVCLFHRQTKAKFFRNVHEKLIFNAKDYPLKSFNQPFYLYWGPSYVDTFWRHARRDINLEVKRLPTKADSIYFQFLWFNFCVILGRIGRLSYFRLTKPRGECMPIRVEFFRIWYYFLLSYRVTIPKVKLWLEK